MLSLDLGLIVPYSNFVHIYSVPLLAWLPHLLIHSIWLPLYHQTDISVTSLPPRLVFFPEWVILVDSPNCLSLYLLFFLTYVLAAHDINHFLSIRSVCLVVRFS